MIRILLTLFCLSSLSTLAAGVTVITHGFNSTADTWVTAMCQRILQHPSFQGSNATIYRVSITKPSTSYVITQTLLQGVAPTNSDSGEIVIALDWSSISGLFQPSTSDIAAQAAAALLSTNLFPNTGGRALAQMPIHLIGHSRGASMMVEVARVLGAQGVWVDHLTLLDPYPLSLNGDPAVKIYANVFFAESFRQTNNDPKGVVVGGVYDRLLTGLTIGGYPATQEHSDVHLWYHGTVDFRDGVLIDGAMITGTERVAWWKPAEQEGTNAGFRYSLIAQGDRFLTNNPGGTSGAIADGINKQWNLGAGQSPNRTALPANNAAWPNIVRLRATRTGNRFDSPVQCTVYYQHGTSTLDTATLELCLDSDLNPWNTNHFVWMSTSLNGTGTGNVQSNSFLFPAPGGMAPGYYPFFARITSGARQRVFYAQERIIVPPVLTSAQIVPPDFLIGVTGQSGRTLLIERSADLSNWSPAVTNQMSADSDIIPVPFDGTRHFFRASFR